MPPRKTSSDLIAGVDEVGRGPLAGSVVAAAVILDPSKPIRGLADSKLLSEKKRQLLAEEIKSKALSWSICEATVEEIDRLNILHASMLAMQRAVETLNVCPQRVLVDGNRTPALAQPCKAIVKGDQRIKSISAASIIAKVARDQMMHELHHQHPEFGFDRHKGYPTKAHFAALELHGALPQHRRSFAPVRAVLHRETES